MGSLHLHRVLLLLPTMCHHSCCSHTGDTESTLSPALCPQSTRPPRGIPHHLPCHCPQGEGKAGQTLEQPRVKVGPVRSEDLVGLEFGVWCISAHLLMCKSPTPRSTAARAGSHKSPPKPEQSSFYLADQSRLRAQKRHPHHHSPADLPKTPQKGCRDGSREK